MGRTALVTVPDEGAAWTVRDALAAGGITCDVERAGLDHPYTANALARQMRIYVEEEQLAEARRLLAALEGEVANHDDDLTAQALAAGRLADEAAAAEPPPVQREPSLSWALVVGLLLPLPAVCLYARASRLGLLLVGLFVVGLIYALPEMNGFELPEEDRALFFIAPAAKLADLLVGIALVLFRRPRSGH